MDRIIGGGAESADAHALSRVPHVLAAVMEGKKNNRKGGCAKKEQARLLKAHVQRSAKRQSQEEPGRKLTQPRKHLLAQPCTGRVGSPCKEGTSENLGCCAESKMSLVAKSGSVMPP